MAYSGANVLAHLSELARQRAGLPAISHIIIVSAGHTQGDLIQSVLRAVVGYETRITVAGGPSEASAPAKKDPPQVCFALDASTGHRLGSDLRLLRQAGISCPIAVVRDSATPQMRTQLLELGASDVLIRDEICGVRLRECLLRLLSLETGGKGEAST